MSYYINTEEINLNRKSNFKMHIDWARWIKYKNKKKMTKTEKNKIKEQCTSSISQIQCRVEFQLFHYNVIMFDKFPILI